VKKVLGETQTLHSGCSKVEPKNFTPPQTPFPGVQDGQKFDQFGEDRCTQVRVIMVTDPPTHKHTHPSTDRTDYNYTAPQLTIAQCN